MIKKKWDQIVLWFVILSLVHLILDTNAQISSHFKLQLLILDGIVTIIFLADLFSKINRIRKTDCRLSAFFRFEIVIDFFTVIPFFANLIVPNLNFLAVIRLIRLLRVIKLFNQVKSNNLIINAIKNKKYELYTSFQVVLIVTIILSAILYFVENQSQPENFSSITDAFLWSISKFIGGIGGYGDFSPITFSGKVLATFVGVLGIALFAVPAGIIASGFVEEIENEKKKNELNSIYETLTKAFHFYVLAEKRAKEKVNLSNTRRRYISLIDACVKINKSEGDIFSVCGLDNNIKLSKRLRPNSEEEILIEYFENNSVYGTFLNRKSNITIVSPHSDDGFNLGHYSSCIAEYLNANYISVEKYGIYSFLEEKNINFNENDLYLTDENDIENEVFKTFIQDLKKVCENSKLVINIGTSMGKSPTFHVLNGKKMLSSEGINSITFHVEEEASNIYNKIEELSKPYNFTITKDTHYSNSSPNHLDQFIFKKLKSNCMSIKVNVEIVKGNHDDYYNSIYVLSEAIKKI
jgi:voltage-gated potassium channel